MYTRSHEAKCICALCICMFPPESVYGINGRNADNCLATQLSFQSWGEEGETWDGCREVHQHPALSHLSRHVRYASHGIPCAWPLATAKPTQHSIGLFVDKQNLFPGRLALATVAATSLARMEMEEKEEVGGETMREKSQTAELFAAANAGELIWKPLFAHALLCSHCMQMCYYSCLTRIRCVSAFSFTVPSPSRKALDVSENAKNENNNPVGVQLLATYLPSCAAQPRLVSLMLLPACYCTSSCFGGRWITSSRIWFFSHSFFSCIWKTTFMFEEKRAKLSWHHTHILHQNSQNANLHLIFSTTSTTASPN